MSTRGRRVLLGSLIVATAVLGAACGSSDDGPKTSSAASKEPSGTPVKIGVIADQSGSAALAVSGKASLAGVQTAAKLINDQGGIAGHPVVVKSYDGQSNAGVTSSVVRQAISDHVDVLSGFVNGVELVPSVPVLAQADIPYMYSGNYLKDWQALPLFVMTSTNEDAGKIMANAAESLLGGSLGGKAVAIAAATPSASYDETIASLKAAVESRGGRLAPVIRDPLTINSWASQAANVMSAKVDALIMLAPETSAVVISKALTVAGFKGKILASVLGSTDNAFSTLKLPNFYGLRENGQATAGTKLHAAVVAAGVPPAQALGSPLLFARSYAGTWAAARAFGKCGLPCPGKKFSSALKAVGPIQVPLSPYYGVPDFSAGPTGVNGQQLWHYDATASKSVPFGKLVTAR